MAKETKKQIVAQTTNKIAKKYTQQLEVKNERIAALAKLNRELQEKNNFLEEENNTLKEKVNQYEDWIERLQEFVNMSDEDRTKAIKEFETFKLNNEKTAKINSFFENYINLFKGIFFIL